MRARRLTLIALTALALGAPAGAYADDTPCPGRNNPTAPIEPAVCVGTETDGWGGSTYVFVGTCATDPCTIQTVPVEDIVVTVGGIVSDVYDRITP